MKVIFKILLVFAIFLVGVVTGFVVCDIVSESEEPVEVEVIEDSVIKKMEGIEALDWWKIVSFKPGSYELSIWFEEEVFGTEIAFYFTCVSLEEVFERIEKVKLSVEALKKAVN